MAGTPSNYGYTLRRAKGAPWVAHSSRNIPLRSIFPLRPDTAPFWWIERAPCRDVLDQIRPSAGLRISLTVMRTASPGKMQKNQIFIDRILSFSDTTSE